MTSQLLHSSGKIALIISLFIPLMTGCTSAQAVDRTNYSTATAQADFSEAQLDSLLAPIALYPDTVLSHVLIAATYPIEVVEADRWARSNSRLKGDDAVNAVDSRNWDPSVKALVAFPAILQRMSEDLDWTQQLGDAFLADETSVMDSIQKLRSRAYASGNLDKVEHVRVVREDKIIVIEPSVERVVYVPAYDTRVVYGNWWWADYPPHYWHYPSSYVFVSGFYWGPRVHIGPRFYFSGVHWHDRRVVVVDHHNHGHRFYSSRSVVRHNTAKHWHHNPVHRRGVAYHDNNTRARFHSPRESTRDSHDYRTSLRNNSHINTNNGNDHIVPNRAREQRQGRNDAHQGRNEQLQQRRDPRQAGQVVTPTNRPIQTQQSPARTEQPAPARAEQLRERMNNRNDRQHINQTESPRMQAQQRTENARAGRQEAREITRTETTQPAATNNRFERAARTEQPQRMERSERMEQPQRVERAQRTEQPQRIERAERAERNGGGRENMNRGEMRGGRER